MAKGKVRWFNKQKGFGFIEDDEGGDYFVHYSAIEGDGLRNLEEGERVSFEPEEGPKGPRATKVKSLG